MPPVNIVNSQSLIRVNTLLLRTRVGKAMKILGCEQYDVGVELASSKWVRALNRKYRGKDSATDILSFPTRDLVPGTLPAPPSGVYDLGDMVIALPYVYRQCLEWSAPLDDRLAVLAVHGLAHLLGHDHERGVAERDAMEALEDDVLRRVVGAAHFDALPR